MDANTYGFSLEKFLGMATDAYKADAAKDAAKANANAQTATAQSKSAVMKYVLVGGGILIAVVLAVILFRRK